MTYTLDAKTIEAQATAYDERQANKQLLEDFVRACEYVEFWSDHGNYGDGKYEEAKAHRKELKRLVLDRMNGGKK